MRKWLTGLLVLLTALASQVFAGTATINSATKYQTISGFGASSQWVESKITSSLATTFWADDSVNGHAGLSIIRLGVDDSGNSNWGTACGSATQALKINPNVLVFASPWSPPAKWKNNNATTGNNTGNTNGNPGSNTNQLSTSHYSDYATYLTNFVKACKSTYGFNLYALSVQNEPDYDVTYDSCLWSASAFDSFIGTYLGPTLATAGFNNIIMMPESFACNMSLAATTMGDANAAKYVRAVGQHLYGGGPNPMPASYSTTAGHTVEMWETETSEKTSGGAIDSGIYYANQLHKCIVDNNYNAYCYWWLVNMNSDDEGLCDSSGNPTKRLYTIGNYSKFVKPGYVRIGATEAPTSGLSCSAYQDPKTGKFAIVVINQNSSATSQQFSLSGISATSVTPWITDASNNLVQQSAVAVSGGSFTVSLPAQSVMSFVGTSGAVTTPVTTNTFTKTNTPVAPTNTFTKTNTPVAPTNTFTKTNTPVAPTNTFTKTNTPVAPTNTFTKTNTPVAPTNTSTKTNTPVAPTATITQTSTPITPTTVPTSIPTIVPTIVPTVVPTDVPPTIVPTVIPTVVPPTIVPTVVPTDVPPTIVPTVIPTVVPPTIVPTVVPTDVPPTIIPTVVPTDVPPTVIPTAIPTNVPPTVIPTAIPTNVPPTAIPTAIPTNVPPTAIPTNSPTVVLPTATYTFTPGTGISSIVIKLREGDTNNSTSSPHPQIQVINRGTAALNLNNVEVRYWFNCDCTGQAVQVYVDWAGKMPQGQTVGSNVQASVVQANRGGQTGYLSFKFTGNITLQPNEYVEIQARFNKSDWSNMTQSNDWSFSNSQSWTESMKVTGYSGGTLVWGQEPPTSQTLVMVANVITYPNPATSASGATLKYTIVPNSSVSAAGTDKNIYVPDPSTVVYLRIFTTSGRLIWQQTLEGVYYVSTGEHSVKWNGRTAGGYELAAGSYTLQVELKEKNGSSKGFFTVIMSR